MRSATLDAWPRTLLELMKAVGNDRMNAFWEGSLPDGRKPSAGAPRAELEACEVVGTLPTPFAGTGGNREFFLALRRRGATRSDTDQ